MGMKDRTKVSAASAMAPGTPAIEEADERHDGLRERRADEAVDHALHRALRRLRRTAAPCSQPARRAMPSRTMRPAASPSR